MTKIDGDNDYWWGREFIDFAVSLRIPQVHSSQYSYISSTLLLLLLAITHLCKFFRCHRNPACTDTSWYAWSWHRLRLYGNLYHPPGSHHLQRVTIIIIVVIPCICLYSLAPAYSISIRCASLSLIFPFPSPFPKDYLTWPGLTFLLPVVSKWRHSDKGE